MTATLLHGDCLELMKTLPDKSIDLFICDLPYGCLTTQTYKGVIDKSNADLGQKYGSKIDWDIKIDLDLFWKQVERLMKNDHTPIIHFCNAKFGFELIKSKESWFRYDLVWSKSNGVGFLSANKMPLRSHENIYVFSKKGAKYNRIDIEGNFPASHYSNHKRSETSNVVPRVKDLGVVGASVPVREGIRCVKSVIDMANKKGKGKHPTQKPDELYKWLIERYSNEGDTILDPTAGSFASVFTARDMRRNAIGIEMNDDFYNKANK
jgi:site-specific DNA-methyltransferase (adenine-specific)